MYGNISMVYIRYILNIYNGLASCAMTGLISITCDYWENKFCNGWFSGDERV